MSRESAFCPYFLLIELRRCVYRLVVPFPIEEANIALHKALVISLSILGNNGFGNWDETIYTFWDSKGGHTIGMLCIGSI